MIPLHSFEIATAAGPPKKLHPPRTLPLTDMHRSILAVLVAAGCALTPGQIADRLEMHYTAVSNYTRLLVNHGLIKRRIDGTFIAKENS